MSQPLLVTGTIGIDTILTPSGRADGVLGGSVSFAAVAALLFADRVDAVSIIGEDFPGQDFDQGGLADPGRSRKPDPQRLTAALPGMRETLRRGLLGIGRSEEHVQSFLARLQERHDEVLAQVQAAVAASNEPAPAAEAPPPSSSS